MYAAYIAELPTPIAITDKEYECLPQAYSNLVQIESDKADILSTVATRILDSNFSDGLITVTEFVIA